MEPKADNISSFEYLFDTSIIIKNPNYVICINCLLSNHKYYYGTYMPPGTLKELFNIVADYMYSKEEYELFQFQESNFKITIKQIC